MSNRTAKFVSAIFASFLAGAPLAMASDSAAGAADECLSGPKGQTPQGSHWYYRIDRATKRHCWYLADQREPLPQTAASNPSAPAKPLAQAAETAMQTSVANAHAELPAQPSVEPQNRNTEIAPALSADAVPVRSEDHDGAAAPGTSTQQSVVASRWPDSYSAEPPANPAPNTRDPDTEVKPVSRTQSTSVLAAGQFAAADLSSETPTYSAQMRLAALTGVLTLAGIMATVIFKFGNSRQPQPSGIRKRRSPIWESTDDDRIVLSRHPGTDGFARGLDQSADRNERIAEFFAQISGRAPT